MKHFIAFAIILGALQSSWCQYRILGFVYDAEEIPYEGIEVRLRGDGVKFDTLTDVDGRFEFVNVPRGVYKVVVITKYGLIEKEVNLRTSIEMHLQRPRNIQLDEIVVSAVRAPDDAPLTFTNISREEIEAKNFGQDVPYLLSNTPSVVETSDAGTGFGYTGLRIRGTDPTRINVTINGVPLNDAESQSVYWVDLPDLLSSTRSIQVQRGVGSSTFGSGAFGASVNLNTVTTQTSPHAEVGVSGGSFGTFRANAALGTGLINNHFTIDGRGSFITSEGFIDRATADLQSGYLTAAYIGANQSLRLNVIHGHERTYQAWNGVPVQYATTDNIRTFNTAGTEKPGEPYEDEVDDYTQTHYQMLWNASVFTQIQTYATLHYTKGEGYYEQYKSTAGFDDTFRDFLETHNLGDADAVRRRWLDNDFYGVIGGIHYFDPTEKYSLQIGLALNRYLGDHFGEVIWSEAGSVENLPDYYRNDARKSDRSAFVKLDYHFSPAVSIVADMQIRGVRYAFEGLDSDGQILAQEVKHTFLNPKLGLSWKVAEAHRLYSFFGIAQREPNRDDYINSTIQSRPIPEKLYNTELGWEIKRKTGLLSVNLFHMYYKDQLVLTGRINDIGEYTRQNIDKSYRLGVEVSAVTRHGRKDSRISFAWSQNRVKEFDEYIDNWQTGLQEIVTHHNTPLAFSPALVWALDLGHYVVDKPKHKVRLGYTIKTVSKQYLDNTGSSHSILPSYESMGLNISYGYDFKGGHVDMRMTWRNIFDEHFSSNGWIYRFRSPDYDPRVDDPYSAIEQGDIYHLQGLFPQAGSNVLAGINISF